jgi:hypothetical protein
MRSVIFALVREVFVSNIRERINKQRETGKVIGGILRDLTAVQQARDCDDFGHALIDALAASFAAVNSKPWKEGIS